jgi:hypothetical protein
MMLLRACLRFPPETNRQATRLAGKFVLRIFSYASGTPCCSSKHDSKLFRSTGTRGWAPFGPARRYWTGHAIGCSSSRAARKGQYESRKNSGHDHGICLFRPNDVLRLNRRSDHSDGTRHDSGFAADAFRKRRLVTGPDRNFRVGHIATGRAIDEIDSHWLQLTSEFNRLIDIPSALDPIRRRDAHE